MHTAVSMVILAVALASVPVLGAQQTADMVRAPLPSQIYTGKKVFISNAGSESNLFPGIFSGRPDRTYDQFYGAMKSWRRYELMLAPADADLVFEIRFVAPVGMVGIMNGNGVSTLDPQLRLVILNPKTRVVLCGFTEHVKPSTSISKNFDQAIANLVAGLKSVAGQPVAAADGAKQ
jgi:hypothetical protein